MNILDRIKTFIDGGPGSGPQGGEGGGSSDDASKAAEAADKFAKNNPNNHEALALAEKAHDKAFNAAAKERNEISRTLGAEKAKSPLSGSSLERYPPGLPPPAVKVPGYVRKIEKLFATMLPKLTTLHP